MAFAKIVFRHCLCIKEYHKQHYNALIRDENGKGKKSAIMVCFGLN